MTIQQRSRGELYDRSEYDVSTIDRGRKIARSVISIHREVKGNQFDDVIQSVFEKCPPEYLVGIRGKGTEKIGPAVNILQSNESRQLLSTSNISAQEIIDELYDEIPSLRKTKKIETEGVEPFGWQNSRHISLSYTIEEDAVYDEILHERCDSIDKINEMIREESSGNLCDQKTLSRTRLHLSVVKLALDTPDYYKELIKDAMINAMPKDILLCNASIVKNELKR